MDRSSATIIIIIRGKYVCMCFEDFILMSLVYQFFMNHVSGVVFKKLSPYARSSTISPILPSRSLIVLCLDFEL